jgi:hypothetical protein
VFLNFLFGEPEALSRLINANLETKFCSLAASSSCSSAAATTSYPGPAIPTNMPLCRQGRYAQCIFRGQSDPTGDVLLYTGRGGSIAQCSSIQEYFSLLRCINPHT